MSDMAIRNTTTSTIQSGTGASGTTGPTGASGATVGQGVGSGGTGVPNVPGEAVTTVLNSILTAMGVRTGASNESEASNATALNNIETNSGDALDRLSNFLSLIRSDDILAKLMIEQAGMNRQQALDQRLAARDAAQANLLGQAQETKDSAAAALAGAIVQAVVAIVASVVTIAMSGMSLGKAKEAFETAKDSNKFSKMGSSAEFNAQKSTGMEQSFKTSEASKMSADGKLLDSASQKLNTEGMTMSQLGGAYAGLINAAGSLGKGFADYVSKMEEAEGMEKAADAQVDQGNQELAKKLMEEMADLVRTTLEFIKQMRQAETDMMASMTRV